VNRIQYKRKSTSFTKAIIFLAALIMMWIIYQGLNRSGLPQGIASLINADFENFRDLEEFSAERTEEVQKQIAGFWLFSEGDEKNDPVSKREYLEIIDNGIIWHVKQWFLNDPAGGRHVITNIVHGFVKPFSYSQDGSVYVCETRIIRQAFIAGKDTCYGASQQDEIWQVYRKDGVLTVNQREYTPYNGELSQFFPDGDYLDLVDKVTISRCPAAASLAFFARRMLAESFVELPASARTKSVESLIAVYYKPLVFDELVRRYDPRAVPDEMDLQFTLTGKGSITNLKNRSAKIITKRFDDVAVADIERWLFPSCADKKEGQRVEITVKVR
jgi:hypothetical protein